MYTIISSSPPALREESVQNIYGTLLFFTVYTFLPAVQRHGQGLGWNVLALLLLLGHLAFGLFLPAALGLGRVRLDFSSWDVFHFRDLPTSGTSPRKFSAPQNFSDFQSFSDFQKFQKLADFHNFSVFKISSFQRSLVLVPFPFNFTFRSRNTLAAAGSL